MKPSARPTVAEIERRLKSRDLQAIIDLPAPRDALPARLTTKTAVRLATLVEEVVIGIIEGGAPDAGKGPSQDAPTAWEDAAVIAAAYHLDAFDRVTRRPPYPADLTQSVANLGRLVAIVSERFVPGDEIWYPVAMRLGNYLAALLSALALADFRAEGINQPETAASRSQLEAIFHRQLADLSKATRLEPDRPIAVFARVAVRFITRLIADVYDGEALFAAGLEDPAGPFSRLKLGELPLLARRDSRIVKRVGRGRVANVFEQQLSLVLQSLGLYVVPATSGTARVDLICVSPDPVAAATFLVEAKSSARPYTLPKDDERALVDYVRDSRRLTTLPPLEFVLLVGHEASTTLASRLQRLERELKVPVRFLRARDLARLRERLVGPAPFGVLRQHILGGSHILPEAVVDDVCGALEIMQRAHVNLVDALLLHNRGGLAASP